jgi:hypothetical protein
MDEAHMELSSLFPRPPLTPLCHTELRQDEMEQFGISILLFTKSDFETLFKRVKLEIRNWKLEILLSLVPFRNHETVSNESVSIHRVLTN